MKLKLKRIARKETYTIGKLYIDDQYFCDTLEDKDRGLSQNDQLSDIKSKKVNGETAIPTGEYNITMNVISPRFKNRVWAKPYNGKVPRLLNVPGFDGVLIHPGTTSADTHGCILVGQNKQVGKVVNSQTTFHLLMKKLQKQNDITIEIE